MNGRIATNISCYLYDDVYKSNGMVDTQDAFKFLGYFCSV